MQLDAALDTASGAVSGAYRFDVAAGTPLRAADGVVIDCACRASGRLRGTLQDLGVAGDLAVPSLRVEQVALRTLSADYDIGGLPDAPNGTVKVKAATPVGAAAAQTKVALTQDRLRLTDLRAEAASATARGSLDLPLTDAPSTGEVALDVADLKAWLAAAALDGGGSATGQVKLRADGKRQVIDGTAKIANLRFRGASGGPSVAVGQATVDASMIDFGAGDRNKVDLRMTKGQVGDATFDRMAMAAQGSLSKARLSLSAKGEWNGAVALDATGEYAEKAGRRSLDVASLTGTLIGEKIALQKPLRVAWSGAGFDAEPLALALGDAHLTGHARTGKEQADVSLALAGVPLKLIDVFWPLGLNGRADATLDLKGRWPEPGGAFALKVPRLRLGDAPDAPALAVDVGGDWRRGRLALKGTIKTGEGAPSVIEASLPLRLQGPDLAFSMPREQPVSGTLNWSGDVAALWRFVPIPEHRVRGPAKIDVTLSGTLAKPNLQGGITLTDGYYESLEYGTVLKPIDLAVTLDGTQAHITRLTAGDGGTGKLEATGEASLDPEAGFPFAVTAKLQKLTAVRRDDVQASASGDVKLSGSLKKARIDSKLTTDHVEVRILDRLPPEVATLDVVDVGRAGTPPSEEADTAPPFDVDLAIDIAMPRRVFVRGRGIDSEWKGDLKISGSSNNPRVAGKLTLVRGQMTVVGKVFQLSSGTVTLPDRPNAEPEIALKAVYTGSNLTVTATVSGSVTKPSITLSSSPSMPQDEIVSNVLFNKSSTKLSGYEAAQLGIALADLTGKSGGGVLDFARKTLGVDVLRIESTETTKGSEPVVGAGKYVTKDVYVGVKQGTTPESSSVGVEVESDATYLRRQRREAKRTERRRREIQAGLLGAGQSLRFPRAQLRQPFLDHPLRLVRLVGFAHAADAFLDRVGDRHVFPAAHQLFLQADGARAGLDNGGDPLLNGAVEVALLDHLLHQAPIQRGRRVDRLAGIDEDLGLAPADKLRQQGRFHDGRQAKLHFRHAEQRGVGGDPHVTGGGELEARAEAGAVDPGDDRHRQLAADAANAVHQGQELTRLGRVQLFQLQHIRAGDKGPFPGAGQHHETEVAVRGERRDRRDEFPHQPRGKAVELRPVIDGDMGDAALLPLLDPDIDFPRIGHWGLPV